MSNDEMRVWWSRFRSESAHYNLAVIAWWVLCFLVGGVLGFLLRRLAES